MTDYPKEVNHLGLDCVLAARCRQCHAALVQPLENYEEFNSSSRAHEQHAVSCLALDKNILEKELNKQLLWKVSSFRALMLCVLYMHISRSNKGNSIVSPEEKQQNIFMTK